jgi:hypothetical protein
VGGCITARLASAEASAIAYSDVQQVMAVVQSQLEVRAGVVYPVGDELTDDQRGVPDQS